MDSCVTELVVIWKSSDIVHDHPTHTHALTAPTLLHFLIHLLLLPYPMYTHTHCAPTLPAPSPATDIHHPRTHVIYIMHRHITLFTLYIVVC